MSGYLARLADRLAGTGFDGRISPTVGASSAYVLRTDSAAPEPEKTLLSNGELLGAGRVCEGFEGLPKLHSRPLDRPMAPAFCELQTVLPAEANSPGATFRRTSIPTETHADFVAPLETPYGELGRTKKRNNLVDYGPDMSTSRFPSPANSGLRQQEDPEREAALHVEGDNSSYPEWRETEPVLRRPARATPGSANAEMVDAVVSEKGEPRAQSPARTFQEESDSRLFEAARSHLEPTDIPEKAAIPRLSPRQTITPPTWPAVEEQPKLVIGRLSVEVVQQSEPSLKRPVHTGPQTPNRRGAKPSGHDTGPRTNLNFGLGQV
jgi:hypothetical protein